MNHHMTLNQLKYTQHILRQTICHVFLPENVLQQRMYEIIEQPDRLQIFRNYHQESWYTSQMSQILENKNNLHHETDLPLCPSHESTCLEMNQDINVQLREKYRMMYHMDGILASNSLLTEDPVLCYDRYILMDYQDYDLEEQQIILPWCMIQMLKTHPMGLTWTDYDSYLLGVLAPTMSCGRELYLDSVAYLQLLCATYWQRRVVYQWLCFMHRLRLMNEQDELMKEVLEFWYIPRDWNYLR